MAVELLRDGQFNVSRPDADELLAIRRGARPDSAVRAEVARLQNALPALRERSALPPRPDRDAAHELAVAVVQTHHRQPR